MNNSQIKSDPKGKAIISLVLGIISIIGGTGIIYIYALTGWGVVLVFYFLIPLAGLFLGKIGVKSTQKRLAIVGMGLCIIGLLGVLSFYFFAKMMAETM